MMLTIPIVLGPKRRIFPAARNSSSCLRIPAGPVSAKPLVNTIATGVLIFARAATAAIAASVPTKIIATSGVSGKEAISG